MPFVVNDASTCQNCPYGVCVEDRRANPVPGRNTTFRLKQANALNCTFESLANAADGSSLLNRSFDDLLNQFRANINFAGDLLFGGNFGISSSAFAKVEGDAFELLEALALWNAASAWNGFMTSGSWDSTTFKRPSDAVPTPHRKVAIVTLPRGYDTTKLFKPDVRNTLLAFETALNRRDMELGLSSPDIVGVRLPSELEGSLKRFEEPIDNLSQSNLELLETAYRFLEGKLDGRSFLFSIAVKRTTRSDRLYQPLFEANVLKFLIEDVLRGAAFRFYVHMGSLEGADVEGRYRAASLVSLARGGEPERAVSQILEAHSPLEAAQSILDDLPLFPT